MIKAISGYDGYFITDDGKVYCNLGKGNRRNGKTVDLYQIKSSPIKTGYLKIRMRNSDTNKVMYRYIHRLVAEAFIPNPENKPQVNHKNCIRTDNRVENLEWVTARENTKQTEDLKHVIRNEKGQFVGNFKARAWDSLLPNEQQDILKYVEDKTRTNTSKDGV